MKIKKNNRARRAGLPQAPLKVPPPAHLGDIPPAWFLVDDAATLCGVTRRTAERWRDGAAIPRACLALLQIHGYGLLPSQHWHGWYLDARGCLRHDRRRTPAHRRT